MLIDTHIHVGQFNNLYFAPSVVCNLMEHLRVSHYAVSSTSICEENYRKVLDELRELIDIDGEKVLPVMWITPLGLKGNIAWYLESEIKWRMLKIHPFLNCEEWQKQPALFIEVCDIARELNLPVLIHTGNEKCCQCIVFENIIANNPDIIFILAHGRPLQQAIKMANNYDNVFVDSAFMPVDQMYVFIKKASATKLLWGTDMCIPKYFYPEQDMRQYYLNKLNAFRIICTQEQFDRVTYFNAKNLLSL
ncbi:MAG: amidohydrolase family protein [Muribaculaceae bacterium]|nr:amidohydrolase family protein [Muribaculaceae bacterium]